MSATFAVIDASVGDTPAESNLRRELDADVAVYKPSEGEFPPSVSASGWRFDGVVISGSQTSAYDDRDWIHELTEWIRRVHLADVPTLGICWGHQFLAQALGGRVVDMGEYELGYERVVRLGEDPLFRGLPERFTSFETHSDRVAELPPGAATLARNGFGVQAFRLGNTYGVQFHPEYDRETAVWVTEGKDLPDERKRSVLEGITDESVEAARTSKQIFGNFRRLAERHQPVRRPGSIPPRTR
ncbi:type 1 glutamine amidotransferase [Halorubrum tropicale]|uniref:Glutamine amidotransferase n=1 Tax=Halorubrum tropicale TaxID=1765655 RepID=A0A0M9AP91_9EURY|nr:type 1 glutamine amidotransferase [Halorubrum tropicale]KOX95982.1 glutamine amidotransferase [Halorubrum tropicale]